MNNIPQLIKQARTESGLTQSQFGDQIGATKSYISMLESGKQTISLDKLSEVMASIGYEVTFGLKKL